MADAHPSARQIEAMLSAARAKAEELGAKVVIAIVDANGGLIGYLRMPGAFLVSNDLATDKAWTAASFAASTRDVGALLDGEEPQVREGLLKRPRMIIVPGGVPVMVDDANMSATIDGETMPFAKALAEAAAADAVVVMAGTISEEGADRATFAASDGKRLADSAAAGSGLDWYADRSDVIALAALDPADPNKRITLAKNSNTQAMINAILGVRSASGKAMAAKTVLVLKDNAGVALPASLVGAKGPAILETWFPGQEDGNIVADVLLGKVNPSGKLPVTFPLAGKGFLDKASASQFPGTISADGKQQTVSYSEKLNIGYRWYDANVGGNCAEKAGRNPCIAFPFGHGLSYTSFSVSEPVLSFDKAKGVWTATARVTNTGKRAGAEVVQVYLSLPPSANSLGAKQPPRRLVGFQRVELAPGASGEVSIVIDPNASNHPMSVWEERAGKWTIPQGSFTVWLGRSSASRDLVKAGVIQR
jgi:beta-glucosidase